MSCSRLKRCAPNPSPVRQDWGRPQSPRTAGRQVLRWAQLAIHQIPSLCCTEAPSQGALETKVLGRGLGPHPFTCWQLQTVKQCSRAIC